MGGPSEGPGSGSGWVIGLGTNVDFVAVLAGILGTGVGTLFWGGGGNFVGGGGFIGDGAGTGVFRGLSLGGTGGLTSSGSAMTGSNLPESIFRGL